MNKYQNLCLELGVDEHMHQLLKQSLTHYTYSKNNIESKNNSRFVFLGQTAFKGKVAEILYEYVPGTGMQLQNILGNLFKERYLITIYTKYDLDKYIRLGENQKADKIQHIFVYGILGFIYDLAGEDILQDFISVHFMSNMDRFISKHDEKRRDYKTQCIMLYKMHKNEQPLLTYNKKHDKHYVTISTTEGLVSSAKSKNYKYAHKKAWKDALKALATELDKELVWNDEYIAGLINRKKKIKAEENKKREKKLQAFYAKNQKHSERMRARKEELKKIAAEKDRARREAKQRAKERKALQAKQRMLKEMGLQNISASKRRILEDRGILPKK